MKPTRKLNRRSFLGQVAGGAAAGALALIGGEAKAFQTGPYTGVTDNDTGGNADNAGHGRGPGGNASGHPQGGPQTGVTDADPTDPTGHGRGGHTGYSDSDSGTNADPSGRGRRGQPTRTGITDSDPTDPSGQGRGTSGGAARGPVRRPDGSIATYSGVTDSDSGQSRDPSNYGRGGHDCRDNDSQQQPDYRNRDPVRRCQ